jgi:hypothetical protein
MTVINGLQISTETPTVKQALWKAEINTEYSITFRTLVAA